MLGLLRRQEKELHQLGCSILEFSVSSFDNVVTVKRTKIGECIPEPGEHG